MMLSNTDFKMPEHWNVEPIDGSSWRVRYENMEGHGDVLCYNVASGIVLLDIDLSCYELPVVAPFEASGFSMNWCTQDRCEVDFGSDGSAVVGEGLLCVSSTMARAFTYPAGGYRGLEYFVDLSQLEPSVKELLACFGVDLEQLSFRLCGSIPAFMMRPEGALRHAFRGVGDLVSRGAPDAGALLAATCEVFALLNLVDPSTQRLACAYLQRSQRDVARRLRDAIEADPTGTAHVAAIANEGGMGEASLRCYFARMYGKTPAAFARGIVFKRAARLLAQGDAAISDIALVCGYSNPSKFSSAFRREYGANPLEYRRRKRLEFHGETPRTAVK